MLYHLIAIGGIGMSALARILLARGCKVSGSDSGRSPLLDNLESLGAHITIGYSEENLPQEAIVVYSTHVVQGNVEFRAAERRKMNLIHRSELLAKLMEGKKSLLVAGTHGKTTTSSLLTHVLHQSGLDPTYAIGGIVHSLHANGGDGKGEYFVAESCESDGTFLNYPGFGAIITNIDKDHLDYWKSEEALIAGFQKFIHQIQSKEHLLYCIDDVKLKSMRPEGISYGVHPEAEVRILGESQQGWQISFDLRWKDQFYSGIQVPIIGRHNILNSAAVFVLALQLGLSESMIRSAFKSFHGIGRRVEKRGEFAGIEFFDDYGHHPTEIATTLSGLKQAVGDRRVVAVFQPHRYTRTEECMEEFGPAFASADFVCLTDIYAAGETPIPGVDVEKVFKKISADKEGDVRYFPRQGLSSQVKAILQPGDVVFTIGAGDITKVGPEILGLCRIGECDEQKKENLKFH